MQFELKLARLDDIEGGVAIGRQNLQDLTENAQITAIKMEACCTVLNMGNLKPDQFPACQNSGRDYEAKLDDVIAQVAEFRSAEGLGDTAALDAIRQRIDETLLEAQEITRLLGEQVTKLQPERPAPDPIDDSTSGDQSEGDQSNLDADASAVDTSKVELNPPGDSASAVRISSSPVTNIVVTPLTRFAKPEISQILIVAAGTNLRSFTPVQSATEFGRAMLVGPGIYDIVLEFAGQSMVKLVEGLELGEAQKATVDPNSLISFVLPSHLTLDGFPTVAEVFLMDAGTVISGRFHKKQSVKVTGVPIITNAGSYDVYVEPSGGRFFKLIAGIELGVGQGLSIDINDYSAAIVYADPELDGFELKSVYVVEAGTDISQSHRPVQEASQFGQPLMVPENGSYDIVLEPVNGRRVKVKSSVSAKTRRITYIGPNS